MKEEVKKFLLNTFEGIEGSLYNGDYDDADCAYSVDGGVLEIAIGRDVLESIDEDISHILADNLYRLSYNEVEWGDYFEIDWHENYIHPSSVTFGREIVFCIKVYYIVVNAKIEKLEELFNEIL